MFTIDSMLPILKNDNPSSISITKEALDSFTYGAATGYQAFLAWAMDVGDYIQGDLAVWYMADIRRIVQNDSYDRNVLFILQNAEYAIIITKNLNNMLIEFYKVRIEDIKKELDKNSL